MERRTWGRIALIVIAALAAAAVLFWLRRPSGNCLPVSLDIEWEYSDPKASLGRYVSVEGNGTLYTVEQANGKHFYHAYSRLGDTIWRVENRLNAGCGEALVSLPGGQCEHLNCYSGTGGTLDRSGNYLRVNVGTRGQISTTVLMRNPKPQVDFLDALLTPNAIYAVGGSGDNAAAAEFDVSGRQRWLRVEKSQRAVQYRALRGGRPRQRHCGV